jgi:predicted DNA-binding protein (MmcQ/YjbR family)
LKSWVEAPPVAVPFSARKTSPPIAIMYKVFSEYVILKCDPDRVTMLREQYAGVGHRSHLDRRFVSQSHDMVCAKLTGKQRAELERSRGPQR